MLPFKRLRKLPAPPPNLPKIGGDSWHEKIIDEMTWNMPNKKLWGLYEEKMANVQDELYKLYSDRLKRISRSLSFRL